MRAGFWSVLFLLPLFHGVVSGQNLQKEPDGISVTLPRAENGIGTLRVKFKSENLIQVIAAPANRTSEHSSLVVAETTLTAPGWRLEETDDQIIVSTSVLSVRVNRKSLQVTFVDGTGKTILAEDAKNIQAATVAGEKCYSVKQAFRSSPGEVLYGLGSFESADMALNGKKVTLLQKNRDDVVPVVVSTNHYGLMWDNYSLSEFNDTRGGFYLWSEVADEINYYFFYGKDFDSIVSAYRQLTGTVPMYPKWAFGYMQSKQKYNTQEEIVSIVKGFRERKFPLDLIVQDWMYWPDGKWGQKSFDVKRYPEPGKMVQDIHGMNAKLMISIWPNMSKGTPDQLQLARIHGLLSDSEHLNILMPEAREQYWKQVDESLTSLGIDALWADCSEGYDSDWTSVHFELPRVKSDQVNADALKALMNSGRYINVYALMHTKGLCEGWRSSTLQKRVFILTRSTFAGMQRYGASYWTGDVSANWESFREQVPAGLNYCLTGLPYWTTDIAGYFVKHEPGWWMARGAFEKGQEDEGFNELYTRWFQFAAFCPLFRAHGADFPREPWCFGSPESRTYQTLLKFTNLRYRLMPYLYSVAWRVTSDNYTMMRALPFDFMNDSTVYTINDQYLFGPSIMVNPVMVPLYCYANNVKITTADYTRKVYLPKGTAWYDFWTGKEFGGGQYLNADASYETLPLFVRAGSILPMGPFAQYSTEKDDPIEIRIYAGADGKFTLYEDENDNYDYLKGLYSTIELRWNDAQKQLIVGERKGSFPGMPKQHTFNIVLVRANKGTGVDVCPVMDKTLIYSGKEVVADLR